MRVRVALAAISLSLSMASVGQAQNLFGRDTVQGVIDLRMAAADGPRSWEQGGFGKSRFSGGDDSVAIRPMLANAEAVWRPQFSDDLSLVIDAVSRPHASRGVDAAEAFILYRPVPTSSTRFQIRAGLLYPPISLEHVADAGEPWIVRDTITPSAINSWVGEELKVIGGEARVSTAVNDTRLDATAAVFGFNDTSGTLLTFRGWALHDVVGTAVSRLDLPPMNPFISRRQAPQTKEIRELDQRAGWYGRLGATETDGRAVSVLWYDNNGDRRAVDKRQWSWDTRFYAFSATLPLGRATTLTSQLMDGRTAMGFHRGASFWVDLYFQSAYLAVSHSRGPDTFTARLDTFRTRNRPLPGSENYGEDGTAQLLCWKHAFAAAHTGLVEISHTSWRRPSMASFGLSPQQDQTTLQAAWRISF